MEDDTLFVLTLHLSPDSADLVASVINSEAKLNEVKSWSTPHVAWHEDNAWHIVRDVICDWMGDQL
jgi:hypothetical protein